MSKIYKIVKQGEPIQIPSQKAEGGQLTKSMITLQELGGKYANTYLCTMFGNTALCKWTPGEIVFASLRFEVREQKRTNSTLPQGSSQRPKGEEGQALQIQLVAEEKQLVLLPLSGEAPESG